MLSPSEVPVAPGRLPVVGHALPLIRNSRLEYLQSLRTMGDAVQIYLGPKQVYVLNSPELIHRMLTTASEKFSKGWLIDQLQPFFGNGLVSSHGQFHQRQRRMIRPAFNRDSIARYTTFMNSVVSQTVESWNPGETIAVEKEMHGLVAQITSRALFDTEDAHELTTLVRKALPRLVEGVSRRTLLPSARLHWLIPGNREFNELGRRLRETTRQLIAGYETEGANQNDLVSMLVNARDATTGERMSEEEMVDEVLTILISGIETTATTLTWACYELGRRADLRERLFGEADAVLAGRTATGEDVPKLEFTHAFVNEVLRIYHPDWLLMRRALEPVDLGSVLIPTGAEVILSLTTLHRDPKLYPDPLRVDPDRWLTGQAQTAPRGAFIPFGIGNRKCIGDLFAWSELHIILATIATRWQFEPVPKKKVKSTAAGVFHIRHLPMTVRPRQIP